MFCRSGACAATAVVAILLLFTTPAQAQVYKCVDTDGNPSYSQTPCPDQPSTEVNVSSSSTRNTNCSWARRFALDTARRMRGGRSSTELFNIYGGVDSVSKGTVSLINYVYQYEHADEVSSERVATLTFAMCSGGSLGDVSCEALPFSAGDDPNRCEADSPDDFEAKQAEATGMPVEQVESAETVASDFAAPPPRVQQANDPDAFNDCRQPVRDEMDRIYALMRDGYDAATGERYRERINELRLQYRECTRR